MKTYVRYDDILLNSARTITNLSDKSFRENKNTFYFQYLFL